MDYRNENTMLSTDELDRVTGGLGEKIMPKLQATIIRLARDAGYLIPSNDVGSVPCVK